MKECYLLKGYIKSRDVSVGPFTIDFDFDKKIPSSEQKVASLYVRVTKKTRVAIKAFYKLLNSRKEISFVSKGYYPKIILKGITNKTVYGDLDRTKLREYKRLAKLYFETFEEKYGSSKNLLPKMVFFQIEDLVLFRPALRTKDNFFPEKGKPGYLRVAIGKYDNCLNFSTRDMMFETSCGITANILPRNQLKFKIAVNTRPYLMVKPIKKNQTETNLIYAGENIRLLLSLLEERFINYVSEEIHYKTPTGKKPIGVFRHTFHSKPMKEPWRRDLKEDIPMDKFHSKDMKTIYLNFERIRKILSVGNYKELNLPAVFFLYLNGITDRMVYNSINNFYGCVEKLLKIAKEILKDFEFNNTKSGRKHQNKVRKLCEFLSINYSDLLDRKEKFGYAKIRDDYIHNLSYKHKFEQVVDAKDKARYLCRRIIFTFLGLDYRKYNSCDPQEGGRIGL